MAGMAKQDAAQETAPAKFTKDQLLRSARYASRRDVLDAVLKDGRTYSHADVEQELDKFLKGKVK